MGSAVATGVDRELFISICAIAFDRHSYKYLWKFLLIVFAQRNFSTEIFQL